MASHEALIVERDGPVVVITNNDPPRNRMTLDYIDGLESLLPELAADVAVRAIVLRGAGEEHFSVGMNLKQIPEGVQRMGSLDAVFDQRLRVLSMIEALPKPVIAVLCGYCLGGGLELPLACHFRVAARDGAQIGLPELDLGTVPAWGGTVRLTRCVGRAHALDIILRAKKLSGPEALRIGLVHEVWPNDELFARARELAHELAAMPPYSGAGVIEAVGAAETSTLDDALAVERRAVHKTMGSRHQREGMMAFFEKRRPDFSSDP